MKFGFNELGSFFLLFIVIKNIDTMMLDLNAFQNLKLNNMDITSMLNDPKLSSMTEDLNNLKNSKEEMEKAGKELKSMGVDMQNKAKKSNKIDSDLSLPPSDLIKIDSKNKKNLLDDNDALAQLGGLKELGISEKEDDKEKKREEEIKKKEEEERIKKANSKLNNIDTLTRSQAHILLDILKQPSFFEIIPQEAQKIVKVKINILYIFILNKK
jgi:hypothetical protein